MDAPKSSGRRCKCQDPNCCDLRALYNLLVSASSLACVDRAAYTQKYSSQTFARHHGV